MAASLDVHQTLYCPDCEEFVTLPHQVRRQYDRPWHRSCGHELDRLPLGALD